MSAHTPGPWHVVPEGPDSDLRIAVGAGEAIAHVTVMHSEDVANARLIAAAPELLQALRNAHTVLALLNQGDVKQDPLAREALRIELMARLAIAKATGG